MTLPRLLLLTEHFPFGLAESFLETEVPYLARHFSVDILPTAVHPSEFSHRRSVPEHVRVHEEIARKLVYSPPRWIRQLLLDPPRLVHSWRLMVQELPAVPRHRWAFRRLLRFTVHAFLIERILQKEKALLEADVHYSYWLTSGALALTLHKQRGNLFLAVSRAHRADLYAYPELGTYQPFQRKLVFALDRVICISEDGRRYLRQKHPNKADQLVLSRLGVNAAPRRSEVATDGRLHVVSCGYLQPVKRIDLLLRALALCTIPVVWTHLGGGALEETLVNQASELPHNIDWRITGPIRNEKILEFYGTQPVDLFVNISISEGLPVSIMEALSYGIPVAATDVGGTSELVSKDSGFLLPKEIQPAALADLLVQVQELSSERKMAMRDAALKTWSEKANASRQYADFTQWLRGLVR